MGSAIENFAKTIQPGDFVLIYFSGYGLQNDINFLLPVDFDPKDEAPTPQKAVSLRSLTRQIGRAECRDQNADLRCQPALP
jgi:uncharacterized caspase-like protein